MGRLDPKQLLELFAPDLTEAGGIVNEENTLRKISDVIPNFSKKLVTRCVYLNILKQTEEAALDKYLEYSGWSTLNTWLKASKEDDNQPFLADLLDLLLKCPVTVKRLKLTDTAKLVKGLRKEGNSEQVVSKANLLYAKWVSVIGATAGDKADVSAAATAASVVAGKVRKTKIRKSSVEGIDSSSSCDVSVGGGLKTQRSGSDSLATTGLNNKAKPAVNGKTQTGETDVTPTHKNGVVVPVSHPFLDAIEAAVPLETPKRKKKLNPSDTTSDPASKKTKPNALSDVTAACDAVADCEDTLVKIIERDMSHKQLSPEGQSVADVPVTPVPSSYSSTSFATQATTSPTASTPSSLLLTPGPDKSYPRGCLHYSAGSSGKKSVRWLPDEVITRVKYFDVAEDERVNVWKQSLQQNAESRTAEGQAFKDRSHNHDPAASPDRTAWLPLQTIDVNNVAVCFRGRDSKERVIEAERQSRTLADIYCSRELCPESPAEPDLASIQITEPVFISLEDQTVHDFSGSPLPPPRSNPLFGEVVLQPHQIALDHQVHATGSGVAGSAGPVMFQSSYVERPFANKNNSLNRPPANRNMTDLRNANGEKVCSYFYKSGICRRVPCRFIHTRDAIEWNDARNGPVIGFRTPPSGRRGRHTGGPQNEAPFSAPEWNSTAVSSFIS